MNTTSIKAVVLLSGGMDSTTALYKALAEGRKVFPFFVQYGQKSGYEEFMAAMKVSVGKTEDLKVTTVQGLYHRESSGGCIQGDTEYDPILTFEEGYIPPTYTPFRNAMLIALAAAYAEQVKAEEIWIGSHKQDCHYPDDTPEAMEGIQEMLMSAGRDELRLRAPFIEMGKKEIVEIGKKLAVPYASTWSCYESKEPCGKCESCIKRKEVLP